MVYKLLQKSRGTMGHGTNGTWDMGHGTWGWSGDNSFPHASQERKSHDLKLPKTMERMNKMNTLNKMNSVNVGDENEH